MPPDCGAGILLVRYTFATGSRPIAVTDSTWPIRPIIATDVSGSVACSPNRVLPGATVSRLVPGELSRPGRSVVITPPPASGRRPPGRPASTPDVAGARRPPARG